MRATKRSEFKFGPVSAGRLREIGIETLDDLRRVGVVEAYCRAKANHPREVSLNLLWGLEASLTGVRWNEKLNSKTKRAAFSR